MPAIQWPFGSGYAATLIGDIKVDPIISVLESDVDAGRPKMRALRSKYDKRLTGKTVLTGSEKETFEAWYLGTIHCGVLPFEWEDENGDTATMRLEKQQIDLLIGSSNPATARWTLSMQLRVYAT